MKNSFGGEWTEIKINLFKKYVHPYLDIMKNQNFKLLYFDGFAGSGKIEINNETNKLINGVASEIISVYQPREFDIYYLVELNKSRADNLKKFLLGKYPDKKDRIKIVISNCNDYMIKLSAFLNDNNNYRVLAFIDPFGMEVDWKSLTLYKDLGIDMWILVPTGIGYNRMLSKNGNLNVKWLEKLEKSLGLTSTEIKSHFYKLNPQGNLFGNEIMKESDAINKIISLFTTRLKEHWKYISEPLPLRNSKKSNLYHFLLLTNNKIAVKIANDIIKKQK